jgi:hypothetical protein
VILDLDGLLMNARLKHEVDRKDVKVGFDGLFAIGELIAFKHLIIVLVIRDRKLQAHAVFQNEVKDVFHPRGDLLNVNEDM